MRTRAPSVFCCTITPFDAEGRLDEEGLRLLVERLAVGGVGAFVGTSSPGEGFALTLRETERLYGVTKDAMAGQVVNQVRPASLYGPAQGDAVEQVRVVKCHPVGDTKQAAPVGGGPNRGMDFMPIPHESVDKIGAEKAGGAGDENGSA